MAPGRLHDTALSPSHNRSITEAGVQTALDVEEAGALGGEILGGPEETDGHGDLNRDHFAETFGNANQHRGNDQLDQPNPIAGMGL